MSYDTGEPEKVQSLVDGWDKVTTTLMIRSSRPDTDGWVEKKYQSSTGCVKSPAEKTIECKFNIENIFECYGLTEKIDLAEAQLQFRTPGPTEYYSSSWHDLLEAKQLGASDVCDLGNCDDYFSVTTDETESALTISATFTHDGRIKFEGPASVGKGSMKCTMNDAQDGFECIHEGSVHTNSYDLSFGKYKCRLKVKLNSDEGSGAGFLHSYDGSQPQGSEGSGTPGCEGLSASECDIDGDGIYGDVDKCPLEAEVYLANHAPADGALDGCPNSQSAGASPDSVGLLSGGNKGKGSCSLVRCEHEAMSITVTLLIIMIVLFGAAPIMCIRMTRKKL
jgi:hypothetical protein